MFSKSGVWTFGFGFWASRETCSYSLSLGLVFGFVDTLGWLIGWVWVLCTYNKTAKPKPEIPNKRIRKQTNQPSVSTSQRLTPKTNCKNRSPGKPKTQTQKSKHPIWKTFKNTRQNRKKQKKTNLRTLFPGRPLLKKLVMGN